MAEDLGARLVRAGLATREQLATALATGPAAGGTLAARLTELGLSEEDLVGLFLAEGFRLEEANDLNGVAEDVLARIHGDMALTLMALPLRSSPRGLVVAMVDPSDEHALRELQHFSGSEVDPCVARVSDLKAALGRAYPSASARGALVAMIEPVEANDGEVVLPLVRHKSFRKVKKTFSRPSNLDPYVDERPPSSYDRPPSKPPSGLAPERTQELELSDLETTDASTLMAEAARLGLLPDQTQELDAGDLEPMQGMGLQPARTEELDLGDVEVVAMLLQKRKKKPKVSPEEADAREEVERSARAKARADAEADAAQAAIVAAEQAKAAQEAIAQAEQQAAREEAEKARAEKARAEKARAEKARAEKARAEARAEANAGEAKAGAATEKAKAEAEPAKAPKSIIPPSEASWADLGAGFADSRVKRKPVREESNQRAFEIGSVLAAIRASEDRDAIVRIACEAATSVARSAIFLALRKGVLRGWEGVGPGIAGDAIRNLWIPASAPSMFKSVLESAEPHRGAYGNSAADNLYRAATGSRGGTLIVQPVMVASNIVAVLCADSVQRAGEERIEVLAHAVGQALKRLIVSKKH